MCCRRGPGHLGATLVLATAILCDLSSLGHGAGEEHHHDTVVSSGEEGHAHHDVADSSGEEHHHGTVVSSGEESHAHHNVAVSSAEEHHHETADSSGEHHHGHDRNCGAHHRVGHCPHADLNPHLLLAYVMLSSVVFAIFVLYLLNWSNNYVRRATYRMLCTSISVYCAVLLNEGLMGLLNVISKIIQVPIEISFGLLIFLVLYATVWWLCYKKQDDPRWLMALESLGGHLMAFAGIVAFGNMMFSCWFQDNIYVPVSENVDMQNHVRRWKYMFVIVLVVIMLLLLFGLSRQYRKTHFKPKTDENEPMVESHEHHHKPWIDEVSGAENEAAALIVGFLILQASVLFITGKQPGLHDHSCKHQVHLPSIALLAGVGTLCLVFMAVVSMVKARLSTEDPKKVPSFNFRKAMAMSAGWCIERSSKWLMIYWWDDSEIAQVSSAFLLSLLAVIVVLTMGKLMIIYGENQKWERVVEDMLESLAVLVGLGWDHAFHVCQATVIDYYDTKWNVEGHLQQLEVHAISKAVMAVILCSVVAPGWVWYLLPEMHKPVAENGDH